MKKVTIKDIAKEAGVSVNCVSRALKDMPDISEKTKSAIRQIADDLGYVYNRNAASLRGGKTGAIGILFDNLYNPFYFIITNYIWERLNRDDYAMIIFKSTSDTFDAGMLKRIMTNRIDGLITFLQPNADANALIKELSLPTVVYGRKAADGCDCIYLDEVEGGRIAAKSFIARGYKKPLYLGESELLACSAERAQGFKEEFESAGITARIECMAAGATAHRFSEYVDARVKTGDMPDCIFCFNDLVAYEVASALENNGCGDIAVIGYDNIRREIQMPGGIASVGFDKRKMTDMAVDMLMDKINGVSSERKEVILREMSVTY